MNSYDPLWLDMIRDVFAARLTDGYLRVKPLITELMAATLTLTLFLGAVVAWMSSFHPIALMKIGEVWLRVLVLWAISENWNFLFDGFMQSVVTWGGLIGGSTLSSSELLAPGQVLLLGVRLSSNFYMIVVALAEDWWFAPFLFIVYGLGYLGLWLVFTLLALALLTAQVEFQYISVFAFLMWPLMPLWFVTWIATGMVRLLIAAALRLGGLAALYSIVFPFVVQISLPDADDPTVQSALSFLVGLAVLAYFVWHGPKIFGASMWPGSGLASLATLSVAAFRR
jgi:hypothetical protein